MKKYVPEAFEQIQEVGFFSVLNCTFKASADEIMKNYLSKTNQLLQQCHCNRNNGNNALNGSFDDELKSFTKHPDKAHLDTDENEPVICYKKDRYLLKQLLRLLTAFQLLSVDEDRAKYLNNIRLRSLASQPISMT